MEPGTIEESRERRRIKRADILPLVEGAAEERIFVPILSAHSESDNGHAVAVVRARRCRDCGNIERIGKSRDNVTDRQFSANAAPLPRLGRCAKTLRPVLAPRSKRGRIDIEQTSIGYPRRGDRRIRRRLSCCSFVKGACLLESPDGG